MPSGPNEPEIGPLPPEQHAEAFALVFSHLAVDQRRQQVETLLGAAGVHGGSPQGLLGARRDGRLAGAVLSQIQPGRTAVVWPPRIVSGEPRGTAARLMAATRQRLAAGDVRIAQAMLDRHVPADERILQEAGFEYLTDLLYLVCLEVELPGSLPRGPLEFEPYSAAGHHRLARMVKATYERTLDCPRLNGVRKIEEVLAGYRATGLFDPNRWLIVRHRGRDVGCLLLADHPEHKNEELVYMGLAASERGHGWGMDVTRHAQWLTRRAGRSRLVLAVDAENGPAIKVYAAAGFRAWDRRRVYVKVFASQG